jgi:hypothetical protein
MVPPPVVYFTVWYISNTLYQGIPPVPNVQYVPYYYGTVWYHHYSMVVPVHTVHKKAPCTVRYGGTVLAIPYHTIPYHDHTTR